VSLFEERARALRLAVQACGGFTCAEVPVGGCPARLVRVEATAGHYLALELLGPDGESLPVDRALVEAAGLTYRGLVPFKRSWRDVLPETVYTRIDL
jgi:hypothetical protein